MIEEWQDAVEIMDTTVIRTVNNLLNEGKKQQAENVLGAWHRIQRG
tara:strand:+ start:300 stop:437 length:138 start_codon:yes stop_codon:yes gene_type:complete